MIASRPTAPDAELSDAALAERAGAGDERAFEVLDRRHRPALLRQCTQILRNGHDAEEAVQGALWKAYRAFTRGQRPASLLPWLMAIARNECFDMIRARRRTEELPLDIESGAIRPDELVVHREAARALRADMAQLPHAQRAALVLRAVGDLPHAQIAQRLGGTATEARTLCHEARLSLAEFEEGRGLACSAVLERIAGGDGRALRARRIRAHLRACEGCREVAEGSPTPRRSRLGGLFPLPSLVALRSLLFGGGPSGAVGGIGSSALIGGAIATVTTGLVLAVSVHAGDPVRVPTPAPAASATTPAARLGSAAATPAASMTPASPVSRAPRRTTSPTPTPASSTPATTPGPAATTGVVAGVQTPAVHVPDAGATVPGLEVSLPGVVSIRTPSVRVRVGGATLPSVPLPLPPAAAPAVAVPASAVAGAETLPALLP